MLPYDYARCHPDVPGRACDNCARFANHPQQTWGERTPAISIEGPLDEGCQYIPIARDEFRPSP